MTVDYRAIDHLPPPLPTMPKGILSKVPWPTVLAAALLAVAGVALVAYALPFRTYLSFGIGNGAFQTFNPTRRYLSGEFPDAGFQPYLGVGVSAFHALVTALLGGDFAASQFMTSLLPPVIVLGYIALLLWLLRLQLGIAIVVWWLAFLLILAKLLRIALAPYGLTLPDAFIHLIEPANSTLATRFLLPLLTTLACFGLDRSIPNRSARAPELRAVVFGVLTGVQPFWSNDYGIASVVCLCAVYWAALSRASRWSWTVLACWIVALLTAFALGLLGAGGVAWLDYNFRGVAADQLWYFGLARETFQPVYRIGAVPLPQWVWVCVLACAWLFWRAVRYPRERLRALLFYATATPLVAGLIAAIGGHPDDRYLLPSSVCLPFAIGAIIMDLARSRSLEGAIRWREGPPGRGSNDRHAADLLVPLVVIVATVAMWLPQVYGALRPQLAPRTGYLDEPALGGKVVEFYASLIGVGHEIAANTNDRRPSERVLSTYPSVIDLIAGARNASGQDLIIHALGERQRERFVDALLASPPRYVTTISDRYSPWGDWSWHANWWFFRQLVLTYRPQYETTTHVVFEPRGEALQPRPLPCSVTAESTHSTLLTAGPLDTQSSAPTMVEFMLTYSVSRRKGEAIGLFSAFRYRVSVEQFGKPADLFSDHGLPPRGTRWPVMVTVYEGKNASARISVTPRLDYDLAVSECTASVYGNADAFQRGPVFVTAAANHSDANWTRGVSIIPDTATGKPAAGLFVRDPQIIATVTPGARVDLASGPRTVSRVIGDQLWLDGPPLDPALDGFPHLVKIFRGSGLRSNAN